MAIGGPGDNEPQVSAGLSAQPLVTSADPSVIGPAAVENLVQSYRNGFITNQDILDRIGQVGQAKKKALLESLGEYVNPDVIQSRLSQSRAAGATADLQTQQAQAAGGLVQPAADLQKLQTSRQAADVTWGGGVSAFQNYAPWFGHTELPTLPDGSPDFQTMGKIGRQFTYPLAMRDLAMQAMEPDTGRTLTATDPSTGKEGKKIFNKWGVEITPGSEGEQFYRRLMMMPGAVPPGASPAFSSLVSPQSPAPPAGGSASQANVVQPAAPAPQAQSVGTYDPGIGVVTGQAKGFFKTPEEITGDLQKQKTYELWEQQKKFAKSFDSTAAKIEKIPTAQQQSGSTAMNALDIALAESIIKLYDPGMAIREFKWDKLADGQPLLERLPNWRPEFLKAGTLTPQGRQRLIEMGYDNIDGADASVRPHIEQAAGRASAAGFDPKQVLNQDEQRVWQGQPFGTARPDKSVYPTGAVSQSVAVTPKTAPNESIIRKADGTFWKKVPGGFIQVNAP